MPSVARRGLDAFIAEFRKAAARDPFGTVFIVPITHLVGRSSTDVVTTLSGFARKVFLDYATSDTPISGTEFRFILACLLRPRR